MRQDDLVASKYLINYRYEVFKNYYHKQEFLKHKTDWGQK